MINGPPDLRITGFNEESNQTKNWRTLYLVYNRKEKKIIKNKVLFMTEFAKYFSKKQLPAVGIPNKHPK